MDTSGASARQVELLEAAYGYVLEHGLGDLSLRPLAAAIGSSPRVLLYLFGSKDGLIRALLARARQEELAFLRSTRAGGLADFAREVWSWLSSPAHRGLLTLWTETYARSLLEPGGPWAGFAAGTVYDWLAVLAASDPAATPERCTTVLAVLRGAMLDLLATGDLTRTTAAVEAALDGAGKA
jgi:AcrR family transcriptional regulator